MKKDARRSIIASYSMLSISGTGSRVEARKRQLARLNGAKPPTPRAALSLAKSKAYQDAADVPAALRAYASNRGNYKGWCEKPMVVKLDSLPVLATAACSKTAIIEKADVVCRWQSLQWQRPTTSVSPVAALGGGYRFGQRVDSGLLQLCLASSLRH